MTLGRDILYAALTGLMHGGLTVYPARWAGLRDAAPLALWDGRATGNLASRVVLENVAPLALWGGRETYNRLLRLSRWVEAYRTIGALERHYAALSGLIHGGTCNPARWAGLRNTAPLALGDSLKPHTVGRAKTYRAVGACVRVRCAGICGGSTEGSSGCRWRSWPRSSPPSSTACSGES